VAAAAALVASFLALAAGWSKPRLERIRERVLFPLPRAAEVVLGAAGVLGLMSFLMLSFAAAWGLAEVVPEGAAFLIVGGAYGVVALVLLALGRQRLKAVKPVPEQTVETLKEDVAWAKQQMS
jgi:hypothetical protein